MGRSLAGKRLALVPTSSEPELPEGCEAPWQETCGYLDMEYAGSFQGAFPNDGSDSSILYESRVFGQALVGAQ